MHPLGDLSQRQLILFDLDGTLVDSVPDLYQATNRALTDLARPHVTEQQVREWVGKGAAKLCENVIVSQEGAPNTMIQDQLLARFLLHYQQNVCVNSRIYTGVVPFLQYCRAQNKTLACVTNKPHRSAVKLLKLLGLSDYFALVLGGDSLPQRKPDPEPLLYAIRHFNQTQAQTLMIGDSRNDVEAARAARVDCIALSYGYNHGEAITDCQPQWVVDSLAQLIPAQ